MPATVIGFTGAFGSGCSTAAMHLRDKRGFAMIALSQCLKDKWKLDNPTAPPKRTDLQRLGDELRQTQGLGILVDLALKSQPTPQPEKIVIDGIRNVGEVERLQKLFGYEFTLVAILSSSSARWDRIGSVAYHNLGLSEVEFHQDDARDRNEETDWGQQVELCVDRADVFIDNSDDAILKTFQQDVVAVADLVTGAKPRHATQDEIRMHMAYAASHTSKCLKRHVGAVVVDAVGHVVGHGYNENPLATKPCVEEPAYGYRCHRDIIRNDHFKKLSDGGARCPKCGEVLSVPEGPPWNCQSCGSKGTKTNLEAYFFPDRAMNWCTAIHAETWALTEAGPRARGGTLYATTFPCMQCAEKIIQAGLVRVCFTEVYPDPHSTQRLELARVKIDRFKGVRSTSFERIFSQVKPK